MGNYRLFSTMVNELLREAFIKERYYRQRDTTEMAQAMHKVLHTVGPHSDFTLLDDKIHFEPGEIQNLTIFSSVVE
jgi:hypothetical protein